MLTKLYSSFVNRIGYYLTSILFLFFWGLTFLFVSPDNYVKISLIKGEEFFDDLMYQNWAFFAPPPTADNRLYYRFELLTDSSQVYTFEVLGPIIEMKRQTAPFNSNAEILEYVLSGIIHNTTDGLYSVSQSVEFGNQFIADSLLNEEALVENKLSFGKEYVQNSKNFTSLKNYGLLVAERHNLDISKYAINIYITEVDMPKFSERNKIDNYSLRDEKILFYSDELIY